MLAIVIDVKMFENTHFLVSFQRQIEGLPKHKNTDILEISFNDLDFVNSK